MSVTLLLRPRPGQRMTVRTGSETAFNGQRVNELQVHKEGALICSLFVRRNGSTLAGWSAVAETSVGTMPRIVVVAEARQAEGTRLPSRLRERTGPNYVSEYVFPTVLAGSAALREFAEPK